jgi:hypothetical protein
MKVLLYPSSTISNNITGGGISGGDGTAHGVLKDKTLKSRVRSVDTASGTLVRLGMDTYTISSTQRFAGVRAKMVWGQTIALGAYLEINGVSGKGVGSWRPRPFPPVTDPVRYTSGDWYFLNPSTGLEWTQSNIDGLESYIRWLDPAGVHDSRVYEIALEVWILDQPVVTNVSPSPFQHTDTNTPKFVWTFQQDDNSRSPTQLGYELKVWTQADAEDVAFDPDDDIGFPPVVRVNRWGIDTRFDLGAGVKAGETLIDLIYGDTYYWAVQAFNHFPPTGAPWFSEWSELTQFTVNEPPVTNVTAPSGAITTTNKPLVTWTYTDPEGIAAQMRYEVAIWKRPGASWTGFDPDTTTLVPAFHVEAAGQDTSAQDTAILDNGGVYRAYVRTAHAVKDQPPYIYGAWNFEDFNINLTPPPAPTLTETFDYDHAVSLIVTPDPPASGQPSVELMEVQRSLDGGVTWAPFRYGTLALSNAFPWNAGAIFALTDPEVPFGVTLQYRAFEIDTTAGTPVYSAPSNIITTVKRPQSIWIKDPADSTNSQKFMSEASWLDRNKFVASSSYAPLGREMPVVVRGLTAGSSTQLHLLVEGASLKEQLDVLLGVTHALYVQTPKWCGYASVSGDVSESGRLWDNRQGEQDVWRVSVPLIEVAGLPDV